MKPCECPDPTTCAMLRARDRALRVRLTDDGAIRTAAQRHVSQCVTLRLLPGERARFERAAIESLRTNGPWGPQ